MPVRVECVGGSAINVSQGAEFAETIQQSEGCAMYEVEVSRQRQEVHLGDTID